MRSFAFFVLPLGAFSSSCATSETLEADAASLLQSPRVRTKEDPLEQLPEGTDQYGREYSDELQHRINRQVQLVSAQMTFHQEVRIRSDSEEPNTWTTTFNGDAAVIKNAGEDVTMRTNGQLNWAKYQQHRVCVGATHNDVENIEDYHVPEFTLDEPICFNQLNIGYLAGYVNCRNADSGVSHYGCDQDSIGLVLAKQVGDDWEVVFPKAVRDGSDSDANREWNVANIEGYSFMGHGHADWYKLEGYTGAENHLQLRINQDGEGGVFLPRGTYRLWYHEDFVGGSEGVEGTEGDNGGVACYHLDFFLCQGSHTSHFTMSEG